MGKRVWKILALACAAMLAAAATAVAGDTVGETTYLDGTVDVYRAGQQLDAKQVDIGAAVENYDILKTSRNGTIEITLTAGPSPDTTIRVDPNTSFTVEVGKVKNQPKTTVNMISGTISLKVRKITGGGNVEVKTDSAVMGVRGTEFSVTTPPSGDILISCTDGSVACQDESGTELLATPGTAVEKIVGERFRTIPVAVSSLKEFQNQWNAERISALRANATRAIQNYAARYNQLAKEFDTGYQSLMQQSDVLNAWATEDASGQVPASNSAKVMSDKKKIIGSLLKIRGTLFLFERVYFRVLELADYHREGYGRGKLSDGTTTDQFFAKVEQERAQQARRLSRVQFAARMYAERNDGEFPAGLLGGGGGAAAAAGGSDDGFGDTNFDTQGEDWSNQ
jgi:hypothetical protein